MNRIKHIIKEETRRYLMEYADSYKNQSIAQKMIAYADDLQNDLNSVMNDGVHSKHDIVLLRWQEAIDGLRATANKIE
jgi:hypothetical protein